MKSLNAVEAYDGPTLPTESIRFALCVAYATFKSLKSRYLLATKRESYCVRRMLIDFSKSFYSHSASLFFVCL